MLGLSDLAKSTFSHHFGPYNVLLCDFAILLTYKIRRDDFEVIQGGDLPFRPCSFPLEWLCREPVFPDLLVDRICDFGLLAPDLAAAH